MMEKRTMKSKSLENAELLIQNFPLAVFRKSGDSFVGVNPLAEEILEKFKEEDVLSAATENLLENSWKYEIADDLYFIPELSEDTRRRKQLLEKVGCLAGGIAHNFNNPLNTISGQVQLMVFREPDRSEFTRLDDFSEKLAILIRSFGERVQRILENEASIASTWLFMLEKEIDFYHGNMDFKHFVELELNVDGSGVCPLSYKDASWLIDGMIDFLIQIIDSSNTWKMIVSLENGWPAFKLIGATSGSLSNGIAHLISMNKMSMLHDFDRSIQWTQTDEEISIWVQQN
jgi:hypothetical protein